MKLGFSKPTPDDAQRSLLFSHFQDTGYDGLQLKPGQYDSYLDQPTLFSDQYEHYTGVASGLIMAAALDESGQDRVRTVLHFAGTVGAERVIFCHDEPRANKTPADIANFAEILSDLASEAVSLGTSLSLHHHYKQPVMHRSDFDTFFDTARGPVGLTVDTAHLVKSGVNDIAELIRSFREVIDNFHLKDYSNGEWQILGHGDIDFEPVFAAIHDIRYDGWLSADEESGSELLAAMRECRQFMGTRLEQ